MDQASRIIARWSGVSDVISHEQIACGAWKRAVGKRLSERTRAVKLVRNRLVIEVEDEVWRSNLWSLRLQILRNLEKALGPGVVTELSFTVMPARREPQRANNPMIQMVDDASEISDPGLRRIYRNARSREIA